MLSRRKEDVNRGLLSADSKVKKRRGPGRSSVDGRFIKERAGITMTEKRYAWKGNRLGKGKILGGVSN